MTGAAGDDPAALRDLASELARGAGDRARDGRDRERETTGDQPGGLAAVTTTTKSSATDLVTEHDRAAERFLADRIATARPRDAIVGEEGADVTGTSGIRWYLDPIDGTTNFVYAHPMWATSVAAGDEGGMLAGAVYAPDSGELFAAARGRGATLNGRALTASATDDLAAALIATGFSYTSSRRRTQAALVAGIIDKVRDMRRGGSAALDLCYVAAGRLDGYFERPLNAWDLAAGELIAREAGCRSGAFDGGPASLSEAFVAAPGIFDELHRLVAEVSGS